MLSGLFLKIFTCKFKNIPSDKKKKGFRLLVSRFFFFPAEFILNQYIHVYTANCSYLSPNISKHFTDQKQNYYYYFFYRVTCQCGKWGQILSWLVLCLHMCKVFHMLNRDHVCGTISKAREQHDNTFLLLECYNFVFLDD